MREDRHSSSENNNNNNNPLSNEGSGRDFGGATDYISSKCTAPALALLQQQHEEEKVREE